MKKENRIFLTGGHAGSTAYALIEEIKKAHPIWKLYWVGVRHAIEGKKASTLEHKVLPQIGVIFLPMYAGRLQRRFTIWTIPSLLKIPLGFLYSIYYLTKYRPDTVISFGGYAAFPVVVIAWLLKIPVIIHEQTIAAGRSNIYSAKYATKIALARSESKKYFPPNKCVVVGNPVSQKVADLEPKTYLSDPPVIFFTGGSRGSVTINEMVRSLLTKLITDFRVVHQTGEMHLDEFEKLSNSLKLPGGSYELHGLVPSWEWYELIKKADIIVSRSGANIVSEILISKRPAVLIPLPFAYLDEQKKNAELAKEFGLASVIDEKDLTPERLLNEIKIIRDNWSSIVEKTIKKKSPDIAAAAKMVELIESVNEKN
jgi:UDP-N-acetylglucosamine--N-acetylmuramyl-(pentapeptide) pyrophosphoryl-undecaprenol N-acetylglucosamine transferase